VSAPRAFDLVAFDVDGTLIGHPAGKVVWNLLNERYAGESAEAAGRMARYLAGELSYARWVDLDIGDWVAAGATREQLVATIRDELHVVPGVRETLAQLAAQGYRLAVISGTLDLTLEVLLPGVRFDALFTNRISFDAAGRIAGWEATPYDMEGKAVALRRTAEEMGVELPRTVYVGDNINDVAAMAAAGLAVAFEPKDPSVAAAAAVVIAGDLRRLLGVL
jgi:phosphoserine phosphatase